MKSILAIDDDRLIRQTFKNHLSGEGFEVHLAADGKEGVARFKELHPDLVILDINLPELDGLGVLRGIREQGLRTSTRSYRPKPAHRLGSRGAAGRRPATPRLPAAVISLSARR